MKACGNDSSNKPVLLPMASLAARAASDSEVPLSPPRLDQPFVTGSVEGLREGSPGFPRRSHGATGGGRSRPAGGSAGWTIPSIRASTPSGRPTRIRPFWSRPIQDEFRLPPGGPAGAERLDPGPGHEGNQRLVRRRQGDLRDGGTLRRIEAAGLKDVVKHRDLILPQLGAPGVAAHLVKKAVGLQGPLRADSRPGSPRLSRRRPQGDGRNAAKGLSAAGARRSHPHRTGRRAEARPGHHPPPAAHQRFRRGRGIRPQCDPRRPFFGRRPFCWPSFPARS